MDDSVTVAIIGAYGFIGKATVNELLSKTNYRVIALSRKRQSGIFSSSVRLVEKQIDYDNVGELKAILTSSDVVINLAGKMGDYGVTYEMMYKDNVEFVEYITGLCIDSGVRQYIHISTPGVQGLGLRLAKESDPYNPQDDYQKTKMLGEKVVISKCGGSHLNYTILRPDFVYGIGDERRIKLYKNIKNYKFALTTSGRAYISPTYVTDVSKGIRTVILNNNAYNEIFNLAGNEVSVLDYLKVLSYSLGSRLIHINIGVNISTVLVKILETVCVLLGKKPIATISQIKFLSLDHSTSIKKASIKIGYTPEVSVEKGMISTLNWLEESGLI